MTDSDSLRYAIPAGISRYEEEIERSRFIATLAHAGTAHTAKSFVDRIRAEFPDASHNCWAYLIGPPGTTGTVGMSDDGEPRGTAGRPMLTTLQHSGVGDVAVVVTRYFGGRKPGQGRAGSRVFGRGERRTRQCRPRRTGGLPDAARDYRLFSGNGLQAHASALRGRR